MDFVGLAALLVGIYLVDSVLRNRPPMATLRQILAAPDKTAEILESSQGTTAPVPKIEIGEGRAPGGGGGGSWAINGAAGNSGSYNMGGSGGKVIPNAKGFAGMNVEFVNALQKWASATGTVYTVTGNGGFRTYADQKRAWDLYKAGKGPKAANPDKPETAKHMSGRAVDLSPRPNARAVALMPVYRLGLTVSGEPWHVGWLG